MTESYRSQSDEDRQTRLAEAEEKRQKAERDLRTARDGQISFDAELQRLLADKDTRPDGLSFSMIYQALSESGGGIPGWTAGALEDVAKYLEGKDTGSNYERDVRNIRDLAKKIQGIIRVCQQKQVANTDKRPAEGKKAAEDFLEEVRDLFSKAHNLSVSL